MNNNIDEKTKKFALIAGVCCNNLVITQLLLDSGAELDYLVTYLIDNFERIFIDTLQLLINYGLDINSMSYLFVENCGRRNYLMVKFMIDSKLFYGTLGGL